MGNFIEELKTEYATQDNRATAYPIYVTIQEQVSIGVIADGYSVSCPYGDGETKLKYKHADYEDEYDNEEELLDLIWEDCEDEYCDKYEYLNKKKKEIEEINIGYIWHPVEFFLTIKGAEEYMKSNAHNHGKLRTYIHHFERRNFEMRKLLESMQFKVSN